MSTATKAGVFTGSNVTLQVKDFDASLKFYMDILGFELKYPVIPAPHGRWAELQGPSISIGLHELMAGQGEINLEDKNVPHIALTVENLDEAEKLLLQRGLKFLPDRFESENLRFAFFNDPSGNRFYLAEFTAPKQ